MLGILPKVFVEILGRSFILRIDITGIKIPMFYSFSFISF